MAFMGLGLHVIVALFFAIYLPSSKLEVVAKRELELNGLGKPRPLSSIA